MEQTILVAGGAGFIGYHLTDKLIKKGYNVVVIDNLSSGKNIHPDCKFIHGDIVTSPLPNPDLIYNLACPASPKNYQKDPIKTLNTCYIGTKRLLEIGVPLLQASTSEVYGDPEQHPQTEEYNGNVSTIGLRACYDEGKRVAETLCHHHNATIVRIFNTYGPYMAPNDGRVVSTFINQALNNEPITVYGNGEQTRSLCYISDMVDGLIMAMEVRHPQPINLGNPNELTLNDLAKTIIELTNSKSIITYHDLPENDPKKRKPDITRARNVLGWEPKVNLIEGLKETIKYYVGLRGV